MNTAASIETLVAHAVADSAAVGLGPLGYALLSRQLDAVLQARADWEKWDLHTLDCFIQHGVPSLARNVLIMTFDDGYRSILQYALPLLEKHRVPATIFITTDFVAGKLPYEIQLARFLTKAQEFRLSKTTVMPTLSNEDKVAAYDDCRQRLKAMSPRRQQDMLSSIAALNPGFSSADEEGLYLRWQELQTLAEHPLITIGSHGFTHALLTQHSTSSALRELQSSKAVLEDKLRRPISYFAYPYGGHSATVRRLTRQSGYSLAFTARSGPDFWDKRFDPYAIPRFDIMELPELASR